MRHLMKSMAYDAYWLPYGHISPVQEKSYPAANSCQSHCRVIFDTASPEHFSIPDREIEICITLDVLLLIRIRRRYRLSNMIAAMAINLHLPGS